MMALSRMLSAQLKSQCLWSHARLLSSAAHQLAGLRVSGGSQRPSHVQFQLNRTLLLSARHLSMTGATLSPDVKDKASTVVEASEKFFIPEPPTTPDTPMVDPAAVFNHLGEPTFKSLDLGTSYFPSDLFLNFFETLHVSCELPWWLTIGIATLTIRLALLPVIIYHRKKTILFQNNLPTMKKLQERLQKAQLQNNILEMLHVNKELSSFMERNEMTSMKNLFILPGINIAVLLSCLSALRSMANYPVASLQAGGLFWFTDLSLPDPYFILPTLCCSTIYLIFYVGADMTKLSMASPVAKYMMTGFPILGFFFIMNMPAAVTYYFTVANCVSLIQTTLMKLPSVRKSLGIPQEVVHPPEAKKSTSGGFMQSFRENAARAKMLREVQERERLDDERFRKAGKSVMQKTVPEQRTSKPKGAPKELRKA